MGLSPLTVYIGYDSREPEAYAVARDSLIDNASIPVMVKPLKLADLKANGLYRRDHLTGLSPDILVDVLYNETHTTEFSFTRWLVAALCLWEGRAIFCDCDFMFRGDIAEVEEMFDPRYAVQVVKHEQTSGPSRKMWGAEQKYYARKNWSSFQLINCAHAGMRYLTPYRVNTAPREWLHAFTWLEDSEIGELPTRWNWLAGISDPEVDPAAVHYTEGTPNLPGYEDAPFADEWFEYRNYGDPR